MQREIVYYSIYPAILSDNAVSLNTQHMPGIDIHNLLYRTFYRILRLSIEYYGILWNTVCKVV